MTSPREPAYAELAERRRQEWAQAQASAAARVAALQKELSQMPDVLNRPDPAVPWSHPGLVCPRGGCASTEFAVTRWVTVNGARYRAQCVCRACQHVGTYDWVAGRWLDG